MPSPLAASLRRATIGVLAATTSLIGVAGCGVPTEPRWDRADTETSRSPNMFESFEIAEPTTRLIEAAPVTAATTIQARVLPAEESVVVAPTAGSIGSILTSTGSAVSAGEPIIEWSQGSGELSESDVLRVEILERQIQLAELEGRDDDAATAGAELQELRDQSAVETLLIAAPLDGVLGRFIAQRSKDYAAGEPLFTVGSPTALRVDLELDGDEFADIVVGTELRVIDAQNRFAEPTPAVVVSVESVEPSPDEPVGTATRRLVSAELAAGTTLVVGERVLVDVDQTSGAESRRVRTDAVLDDGRGPFLIVADDDGWRRVDIDIGVASGEYLEVLTDIEVGTVVIVP